LPQIESQGLEKRVSDDRAIQLQEKAEQRELEKIENQHYDMLWEQDRQKKIAREEADKAHREHVNNSCMATLKEQLISLRAQADKEKLLEQEEAKLMVL
jgi:hypothetical protein